MKTKLDWSLKEIHILHSGNRIEVFWWAVGVIDGFMKKLISASRILSLKTFYAESNFHGKETCKLSRSKAMSK